MAADAASPAFPSTHGGSRSRGPDPLTPFQRGFVLSGKYEIVREVGIGGMAVVYEAIQVSLNRSVAIKVLDPELAVDPGFLKKFLAEADTLAKLSHPNIIKIFDKGVEGRAYFLVTEFVEGRDLDDLILDKQVLIDDWPRIIRETCDALTYIHRQGIIHRDVKASNILIDREGLVRLGDFGIAQMVTRKWLTHPAGEDHPSTDGMGTLEYMAPELFNPATTIDNRVDIFALGVLFYKMMTRRFPEKHYRPPSEINQYVSPAVDTALARAMAPNRQDRFDTVDDFRAALLEAMGTRVYTTPLPIAGHPPSLADRAAIPATQPAIIADQPGTRLPAVWILLTAIIALSCIALGAILAVAVSRGEETPALAQQSPELRQLQTDPTPAPAPMAVPEPPPVEVAMLATPRKTPAPDPTLPPETGEPIAYTLTTKLPPGRYEYKFIVDSQHWYMDKLNPETQVSDMKNSVFSVPGGAFHPNGMRAEWPRVNDATGQVTFRFETSTNPETVYVIGSFSGWESRSAFRMMPEAGSGQPKQPRTTSQSLPRAIEKKSAIEETAPLPMGRGFHASAVAGEYLYLIGGRSTSPTDLNIEHDDQSVWYGKILSDGQIANWSTTTALPAPRYYAANSTVVVGKMIYVIGGSNKALGGNSYNNVVYTRSNADGSLAMWQNSPPFGEDLSSPAAVATAGHIHIIGGQTSDDRISGRVWSNKLRTDGTLAEWQQAPSLPVGLWFHHAGVVDDRVYVWGGLTTGNFETPDPSAEIYSAPVDVTGKLGAWRLEPRRMEIPFYSASAAVAGDYLISFCPRYAGREPSTDVWWTKVINGNMMAWQKYPTNLNQKVYHAAAADTEHGLIYLSGGRPDAGESLVTDVVFFRLAGN